jgi:hypothetical protein
MTWRKTFDWEINDSQTITIKRKPHRNSLRQTEIDHHDATIRRRNNGALFDQMTRVLTQALDGKCRLPELLRFARRIADQQHVKIDRLAKRLKDCLICWFCEHAPELIADPRPPLQPSSACSDDELDWLFD